MKNHTLPAALLGSIALALVGYGAAEAWAAAIAQCTVALIALTYACSPNCKGTSAGAGWLAGFWVLLAVCSLGWTRSIDPSLDALAALVAAASLFVLAEGIRGRQAERWFATGLAVVAGLVAVWAVVRVPGDSEALGPFGNANHLATWMLVPGGMALSAFLHADIRRRGRRESGFLWFLLCGAAAAAVAVTGSLGGAIAGAAAVAVAVVGHRIRRAEPATSRFALRALAATGAAAYVVIALAIALAPLLLPDQLPIKEAGNESSAGLRWAVYGAASRAGLEAAPWGTGLGGFPHAFAAERPEGLPYGVRFAHSEPLQGWVELGLPFLLLWLVSVVSLAHRLAHMLHVAPSRFRIGAVAGLCGIGVHSLFDFPLHVPAIAMLAAVALGFAWRHTREERVWSPIGSRIAFGCLGIGGLVLSGTQLAATGYEQLAHRAEAGGDFRNAIAHAEAGLQFRPERTNLLTLLGDGLEYSEAFDGDVAGVRVTAVRERAVAASPHRADLRLRLARTQLSIGDRELAAHEIAAAVKLEPSSPAPRLAAASLALRGGDPDTAENELRAAVALHPRLATELAEHAPRIWGRLRSAPPEVGTAAE